MGLQEKFVSALEDYWGAPPKGVTRLCQVKDREVFHHIGGINHKVSSFLRRILKYWGREGRKSEGSVREEEEERMWE